MPTRTMTRRDPLIAQPAPSRQLGDLGGLAEEFPGPPKRGALVLDLSGTLVRPTPMGPRAREGIQQLLDLGFERFQSVWIYSGLPEDDVRFIITQLAWKGAIYWRDRETVRVLGGAGSPKDLRRIEGVPLDEIIYVGDAAPAQVERWVEVSTWDGRDDDELVRAVAIIQAHLDRGAPLRGSR